MICPCRDVSLVYDYAFAGVICLIVSSLSSFQVSRSPLLTVCFLCPLKRAPVSLVMQFQYRISASVLKHNSQAFSVVKTIRLASPN